MKDEPKVVRLSRERSAEAVDVLCEAFYDYPFMRFVIESVGDDYEPHLRALIDFFTFARLVNDDLVLAATSAEGRVVGVANVTLPGPRRSISELTVRRSQLWDRIGLDAQARYESYGKVCEPFWTASSHYHANMIGVRRASAGQGIGRLLLDAVHDASRRDPRSDGVALTTEDPQNVALYEHLGYHVTGTAHISSTLRTWGFFRPDATGPAD